MASNADTNIHHPPRPLLSGRTKSTEANNPAHIEPFPTELLQAVRHLGKIVADIAKTSLRNQPIEMCAEVDLARAGARVAGKDGKFRIVGRGAVQITQVKPGQGAALSPELVG